MLSIVDEIFGAKGVSHSAALRVGAIIREHVTPRDARPPRSTRLRQHHSAETYVHLYSRLIE